MKLTRVTALGAMMLGLLAVPATALASPTTALDWPGPSATALASPASSPPRPVVVAYPCLPLRPLPPAASSVPAAIAKLGKAPPVKVTPIAGCCGPFGYAKLRQPRQLRPRVFRVTCAARTLVFDMPAGGRLITEVRGPRLQVHDAVFYRGRVYAVTAVAGSRFALDYRGKPFVNGGSAIHDGKAMVLGVVSVVTCRPAPPKQSAQ